MAKIVFKSACFCLSVGLLLNLIGCSFDYSISSIDGIPKDLLVPSDFKISFSEESLTITEGGAAQVALLLSEKYDKDIKVDILLKSARNDVADDFHPFSTSVIIPKGSLTTSISLSTIDDNLYEGVEIFNLEIKASESQVKLDKKSIEVKVLDNEMPPVVSLENTSKNLNEGVGNVSTKVSLNRSSVFPITVNYELTHGTTSVADVTFVSPGSVLFGPGETEKLIEYTIQDDSDVELVESFEVELKSVSGQASLSASRFKQVVSIIDNESVNISIDNISANEGLNLTFTISLSTASVSDVTVDYATMAGSAIAGANYTAASGTVTFAVGETSKTISVASIADATQACKGDKVFTVILSNPSLGSSLADDTGEGTITDASLPVLSIADVSGVEGSQLTFTVSLNKQCATDNVTFVYKTELASSGNPASNGDFTAVTSGSGTINAGSTSTTFAIQTTQDTAVELDEIFLVDIFSPTNATLSSIPLKGTGIIENDDTSLGAFTISGVRSVNGEDSSADAFLNYDSHPKIVFAKAADASSYYIRVTSADGSTVVCAETLVTGVTMGPHSYDFSACSLTAGTSYRVYVEATAAGVRDPATNSPYSFYYNQLPTVTAERGEWLYGINAAGRAYNIVADDPATGLNDAITDPDGDVISITSVSTPLNGTVSRSGTNVTYTPAANYFGPDSYEVTLSDTRGGVVKTTVKIYVMSAYNWTGASGVDGNWSTTGNWCGVVNTAGAGSCTGGGAPSNTQVAVFSKRCVQCDASISSSIDVLGITTLADYTGTITQQSGSQLTIGATGYNQSGGSFVGSDSASDLINVSGLVAIRSTATSFKSTRGELLISGGVPTTTLASISHNYFEAPFFHNNGLVKFDSQSSVNAPGAIYSALNIYDQIEFYNFELALNNKNSTQNASGLKNYVLSVFGSDTKSIRIKNDLSVMGGAFVGEFITVQEVRPFLNIYVEGDLITRCIASYACGGSDGNRQARAIIHLVGNRDTKYRVLGDSFNVPNISGILVDKDLATNTVSPSSDVGETGKISFNSLEVKKGKFIAPLNSQLLLGENKLFPYSSDLDDKGLIVASEGDFDINGSELKIDLFSPVSTSYSRAFYINLAKDITLSDLSVALRSTISVPSERDGVRVYLEFGSGVGKLIVLGDLHVNAGGMRDGEIDLHGNFESITDSENRAHYPRYDATWVNYVGATEQTYRVSKAQIYGDVNPPRLGGSNLRMRIRKPTSAGVVRPHYTDFGDMSTWSSLYASRIEVERGVIELSPNENYIIGPYFDDNVSSVPAEIISRHGIKITTADGSLVHNSGTVYYYSGIHATAGRGVGVINGFDGSSPVLLYNLVLNFYNRTTEDRRSYLFLEPDKVNFIVENDLVIKAGHFLLNSPGVEATVLAQFSSKPAFSHIKVNGDLKMECSPTPPADVASAVARHCSLGIQSTATAAFAARVELSGNGQTITQESGARYPMQRLFIDQTSSGSVVNFVGNIYGEDLLSLLVFKGRLNIGAYSQASKFKTFGIYKDSVSCTSASYSETTFLEQGVATKESTGCK